MMMRRIAFGMLVMVVALGATGRPARADAALEQQVKSAFIVNFIQFIDWPDTAFAKADEPLIIGVLDDTLGKALKTAVEGKKVKNRALEIQTFTPKTMGKCHVLLAGALEGEDLDTALKAAAGYNALTIGDAARFTEVGGMIRFYLEDRKVRFEINLAATQRAKLQISSKLLQLAKVVNK
jgi:hypothetical protein